MKIPVNDKIRIELIEEIHAPAIFDMVDRNRAYLRTWLPFADRMLTVEFAQNFVKGTMQRNNDNQEYAFVIFYEEIMVGRIGVYKIDPQNKIGEIGYWIVEDQQGKGIITASCKALIEFCFHQLQLNRIEIRCGTGNTRSKSIPEQLHFTKEGIIRQGELLYDTFIDLNLYALLKSDVRAAD